MIKIEFEVDGEEMSFDMPTNWDEVTIEMAGRIFSISTENKTNLESSVEVISLLTGIEQDYLYMLTPSQFQQLIDASSFTATEIKSELKESITVDDEEYFLKKDFTQLTMGEIISIETLLKKYHNNYMVAMPDLLCIFLRKKKENGKLESFKNSFMDRASSFKKIIVSDVNNLMLFFSDGSSLLEVNTKEYSENPKSNQESEIDSQSLMGQPK
jgi:hypothetical protein